MWRPAPPHACPAAQCSGSGLKSSRQGAIASPTPLGTLTIRVWTCATLVVWALMRFSVTLPSTCHSRPSPWRAHAGQRRLQLCQCRKRCRRMGESALLMPALAATRKPLPSKVTRCSSACAMFLSRHRAASHLPAIAAVILLLMRPSCCCPAMDRSPCTQRLITRASRTSACPSMQRRGTSFVPSCCFLTRFGGCLPTVPILLEAPKGCCSTSWGVPWLRTWTWRGQVQFWTSRCSTRPALCLPFSKPLRRLPAAS
mmetsp:Transcript_3943/g.11522  ORF Transcript_3943/g.11522 Transcript_3943/m.11522 type:complete len:256 (-) Transcript_3943:1528-2295(-)